MLGQFDPISKRIVQVKPPSAPPSLQLCCRNAILTAITLRKLSRLNELHLPPRLIRFLAAVSVHDFYIDASTLPPSSHVTQVYPAFCLINKTKVMVRVVPPGTEINPDHPTFLYHLELPEATVVVELPTKSLRELIEDCQRDGNQLDETFIWLLLQELVRYLQDMDIAPSTHLSSDCILFLPDNQIFLEVEVSTSNVNAISEDSAVYEAPEVLARNNPDSRALTWSTGCLIYEALALEPAFYDREGNNPFAVYINVMQGELPEEPACGSTEIKTLLWRCLQPDVDNRMTLDALQQAIDDYIHYLDNDIEDID